MTIGDRVRELRKKRGMTQEELAAKLGYKSKSSVAHIENGRDIPRSMVVQLADILGTNPGYLMGWEAAKIFEDALNDFADHLVARREEILDPYECLNEEGKTAAVEYVKYLTTLEKYTTFDTPEGMAEEGTATIEENDDKK